MSKINNMRSPKEKESLIIEWRKSGKGVRYFAKTKGIANSVFCDWIKKYERDGIEGLISNTGKSIGSKKGRPKKPKTHEEELENENIRLRIEIERLKKGYIAKGVGAKKEYVTIKDANIK